MLLKIVCISDTHCRLKDIQLPEGGLLIHAGDATFRGTIPEIIEFNEQLGLIKDKYKHGIIFVPGNHDWLFETNKSLAKEIMTNATVLIDESVSIEGKVIYGSPYQPEFCGWAFNLPRGEKLKWKWEQIPDKANVVITHGPPHGILDKTPRGEQVGCEELYKRVLEVKPELHVFGHIHHDHGYYNFNGTTFVNASSCTERYEPTNKPIVIEL